MTNDIESHFATMFSQDLFEIVDFLWERKSDVQLIFPSHMLVPAYMSSTVHNCTQQMMEYFVQMLDIILRPADVTETHISKEDFYAICMDADPMFIWWAILAVYTICHTWFYKPTDTVSVYKNVEVFCSYVRNQAIYKGYKKGPGYLVRAAKDVPYVVKAEQCKYNKHGLHAYRMLIFKNTAHNISKVMMGDKYSLTYIHGLLPKLHAIHNVGLNRLATDRRILYASKESVLQPRVKLDVTYSLRVAKFGRMLIRMQKMSTYDMLNILKLVLYNEQYTACSDADLQHATLLLYNSIKARAHSRFVDVTDVGCLCDIKCKGYKNGFTEAEENMFDEHVIRKQATFQICSSCRQVMSIKSSITAKSRPCLSSANVQTTVCTYCNLATLYNYQTYIAQVTQTKFRYRHVFFAVPNTCLDTEQNEGTVGQEQHMVGICHGGRRTCYSRLVIKTHKRRDASMYTEYTDRRNFMCQSCTDGCSGIEIEKTQRYDLRSDSGATFGKERRDVNTCIQLMIDDIKRNNLSLDVIKRQICTTCKVKLLCACSRENIMRTFIEALKMCDKESTMKNDITKYYGRLTRLVHSLAIE